MVDKFVADKKLTRVFVITQVPYPDHFLCVPHRADPSRSCHCAMVGLGGLDAYGEFHALTET